MTSSARDVRYGRRGGAWLETRAGADVCDTCRNGTVRWWASSRWGETWQVCARCRAQGVRLGADITYTQEATP